MEKLSSISREMGGLVSLKSFSLGGQGAKSRKDTVISQPFRQCTLA